jgi:hypothetical protein
MAQVDSENSTAMPARFAGELYRRTDISPEEFFQPPNWWPRKRRVCACEAAVAGRDNGVTRARDLVFC